MKFYKAKLAGRQISVYIKTAIVGSFVEDTINTGELPNFQIKPLDTQTDLLIKLNCIIMLEKLLPKIAISLLR